ncbi:S-adenosyl-L-methionine-dependent methyltransferase [Xylariaceae sp. FL0594]|nr:S-adenosyl-L-methionine-dependent methyltransferase [Xylariaceae sp. FL0594]
MDSKNTPSTPDDRRQSTEVVAEALAKVNLQLSQCLDTLNSLGSKLPTSLRDHDILPDSENLRLAAEVVDQAHKIRVLVDAPVSILADHFLGYVRSKCLSAVVQQGVPDALNKGPMNTATLARSTGSREDRLGQVMKILCTEGIFTFDESSGHYSNNPASSLLSSTHWTQWHNWVSLQGGQFYDIARGIPESLKANVSRTASQINYDTDEDMFTFFRRQEWAGQLHRTLGGGAAAQLPGILEDYPWHEVSGELVMDLGGGGGDFIVGLLRRYPTMQGGLFDQPHIADLVRGSLAPGGKFHDLSDQLRSHDVVGGDFFKSVPSFTVYTMKWCLHDWNDSDAAQILRNIRKSIIERPVSRLIVLESILSDRYSARLSRYADINMMMTIGGLERGEQEWRDLATSSGWQVVRICDLRRAWVKALELRPLPNM